MSQVKGIPYGLSDFNRIRNGNFYFVDKTMYLPLIEKMPSYLFLIRPRRFGKSVFLSMMRTYYRIMIYCVRMILMHILEISGLVRIQPVKGVSIRYFISISLKRAVRCRERT